MIGKHAREWEASTRNAHCRALTSHLVRRAGEELPGLLASDVLLLDRDCQVRQQRQRVHILELKGPEHGSTPVARPMLRVLAVLDQLADKRLRVAARARLPERGQRGRILEDLLGAHGRQERDESDGTHEM